MTTICPICYENQMMEKSELNEVHYRNHTTKLTLEHSFCPDCGETVDVEQAKRNQQRMMMWRMEVDRKINGK